MQINTVWKFTMGRSHCLKCKKGYKNCVCPTTCRQCLQLGAMGDDGSCNCCKNCSQPMVTCEADDNCGYEPSGATPCHPCGSSSPAPASNNSAGTSQPQLSTFQQQKPPDLNMVFKDSSTLNFFCSLLRKWSRIGGYAAKDQGDIFTIHAATNCPTLAMEMDTKIGDKISQAPDAVDQIIKWLENRYGVDRQVDICKTFQKFFFSSRTEGTDLVTYVNEFEINYSDLNKLGEIKMSELYLALFLFMNAKLNETEFSILYNKLDFDKAMASEDTTILERTKAALRRSQYGKEINTGARNFSKNTNGDKTVAINNSVNNGTSSNSSYTKSLVFSINADAELDDEATDQIKDLVETYIADRKEKGKSKRIYKCKFCLCSCPRDVKCKCECTKHPFWNCPTKNKKKGDKKETEASGSDNDDPAPSSEKSYISSHLQMFSDALKGKTFLLKESSYTSASQSMAINQQVYNTEASYDSDSWYEKPKVGISTSVFDDTDTSVKMYNMRHTLGQNNSFELCCSEGESKNKPSANTRHTLGQNNSFELCCSEGEIKHKPAKTSTAAIVVDCLATGATHVEEYNSNKIKDCHVSPKDDEASTIQQVMENDDKSTIQLEMENDAPTKEPNDDQDGSKDTGRKDARKIFSPSSGHHQEPSPPSSYMKFLDDQEPLV